MEFSEAFGITLRRLRLAKGLTQEAFYTVVSESYVSKLERGKRTPTWLLVTEIALILDVDPLALLTLAVAEQRQVDALALVDTVASGVKELQG
ncbi:helix-turn-helix domain-containing protein [Pseudomonas sp. NPDC090201]|uniref:helix-turn-helix domain-containing protein n=1 Tax=Pseudomonas sp. NPDC090201 TaxID=3364475 RepID=UPI00381CCC94